MRRIIISAAIAACFAAPAMAGTLDVVIAKGQVVVLDGASYDVTYAPDGSFTSDAGVAGTWKVDGKKLCITVPGMFENACTEYPEDKTSGDTFEVTGDLGVMNVTLK